MNENLNKVLIATLRKHLPEGKTLVPYLMAKLEIGKESVYRRIRNDISFSFDEIIALSSELGFSIDEIVGQNNNRRLFFDLPSSNSTNPADLYAEFTYDTVEVIKKMDKAATSRAVFAYNRMPQLFTVHLKNISRFRYYRWMHQTHNVPLDFYLSDISVPAEVNELHNNLYYNFLKMDELTLILDRNVFASIINEILYYYKRGLIKRDELLLIKDELLQIVDRLEILAEKGTNDAGTKINLFVSSFSIDSCYGYFEYNEDSCVQIWTYIMPPITINKPEICAIQKNRIESFRKFSILITQCNEIQRAEYLRAQRKLITDMGEAV
jgi:hypothetical protein